MQEFSLKDLYDVHLKTSFERKIGDRVYEPGETLAFFDKIQLSNFSEIKSVVAAKGGQLNTAHVIWEAVREVDFNFAQGIFSEFQLALLNNAKIITNSNSINEIPARESLESDENKKIILSHVPAKNIFVYDSMGNKVEFTREEDVLEVPESYTQYIVDYIWNYTNKTSEIKLGTDLLAGFIEMEGKTRIKDDVTGKVRTGIIRIPKLKIVSALSINLGERATPIVGNFKAIGYPVGVKGNSTVMELLFLDDDIDSDI